MDKIHPPPIITTRHMIASKVVNPPAGIICPGLSPERLDGLRLETKTPISGRYALPEKRNLGPLSTPDSADKADFWETVEGSSGSLGPAGPSLLLSPSYLLEKNLSLLAGRHSSAPSLPPPLDTTMILTRRLRFVNSSASAVAVTNATLAGALGGVVYVLNTTFRPWTSSMKLLKVTVWPAASSSAEDTVELNWLAGTSGQVRDELKIATVPEGVTMVAPVSFTPPAKSLASDWLLSSTSASIFGLSAPVGSVTDVLVQFTLSNVFTSTPVVVASGTLGNVYYLALDGPASNLYVPIGLPTTH